MVTERGKAVNATGGDGFGNITPTVSEAFEQRLRDAVRSESAVLQQAALHLLASGGKRLRPRYTFLIAEAIGVGQDAAWAVAAAAELLHTGSLIHDDIIDHSELRRSRPAVHVKFGVTNAVLTGDFLLARGLEQLTAARLYAAADEWARLLRELVEAEALQHEYVFNAGASLEISRRVAAGKTAALFAWCARVLAKTAGLTPARVDAADRLGVAFGLAFQIGDDLLDFAPGDTGKPKQKDLREGQLTVPVQLARRDDDALGMAIARCFESRRDEDFAAAYESLVRSAALVRGQEEFRRCRAAASEAAAELSESPGFASQVGILLEIFPSTPNP